MTNAAIIIRTLNEAEHLPRLLEGIASQSLQPTEIILVDSGSTDGTVEIAARNGVTVVRIRPEDFSFGHALNVGCEHAASEFFVFVSAHVYPCHNDWLLNLLEPFADQRVALSYGRQVGDSRSNFSEIQLMNRWFPPQSNYAQQGPFCNNANSAIRAKLWRKQPFDEQLTGLEDIAWAIEARAGGHEIAYEARAGIHHVHEESFRRIVTRYEREAIAHKRIIPEQHMGTGELFGLFLANLASDVASLLASDRGVRELPSVGQFRAAQMYGTWRGFRRQSAMSDDLRRRLYYPKLPKSGTLTADQGHKSTAQIG